MSVLQRISDRMLGVFVPSVKASAADDFTQLCGCYCGLRCYYNYRTCTFNAGRTSYTCGPCTQQNNILC